MALFDVLKPSRKTLAPKSCRFVENKNVSYNSQFLSFVSEDATFGVAQP